MASTINRVARSSTHVFADVCMRFQFSREKMENQSWENVKEDTNTNTDTTTTKSIHSALSSTVQDCRDNPKNNKLDRVLAMHSKYFTLNSAHQTFLPDDHIGIHFAFPKNEFPFVCLSMFTLIRSLYFFWVKNKVEGCIFYIMLNVHLFKLKCTVTEDIENSTLSPKTFFWGNRENNWKLNW